MCVPPPETVAPEPRYGHGVEGRLLNDGGTVTGSRTQRVDATPEPPTLSVALTVTPTGRVYQPLEPFGVLGLRTLLSRFPSNPGLAHGDPRSSEQAGHSLAVMEAIYAHVIAEFRGVPMGDPSEAIWQARATVARQRQTTVRRQQAVP